MKKSLLLILSLLVFQLFSSTAIAQEKDSWLKKLFGKEEENTPVEPSDSLDLILDEYLKEKTNDIEHVTDTAAPSGLVVKAGELTVFEDKRLTLLNDSLANHPKAMTGYRVQIFFGSLEQAREARATYIRSHSGENCVIEHVAPNFSVRVGDFQDQYAAYRRLKDLKKEFPGAIIIPGNIDLAPLPE